MPEVGVVTDSIACLTKELVEQYGIGIVPLTVRAGDKVYKDWVDITPTEAYELCLQDPDSFGTSPAPPGYYLEAYREANHKTQDIVCVTLSAKLSTGYEMACVAKEQAKTELPHTSIEVVDSQVTTAAEGFVALAAARAAAEGKSLAEVVEVAKEVRGRVCMLILMDTVRYVYRSGRIPKIAARAASLLNIRPVLTNSSGLIRFIGAARTRKHGIERLFKIMKDKVGQSPVHVAVMHAYAPDEAERLKERVAAEFNCVELWLTEFCPVMGYACGTGTVGFAFYKDG